MPVMSGISISVMTRSQCSGPIRGSATTGLGACSMSNPARLPSTCMMNRAVSGSSSTSRIRPRGPGWNSPGRNSPGWNSPGWCSLLIT